MVYRKFGKARGIMISDNCQEVMKPNHEAPYWYVEEFEFIL
jgi:hypothetical protein